MSTQTDGRTGGVDPHSGSLSIPQQTTTTTATPGPNKRGCNVVFGTVDALFD